MKHLFFSFALLLCFYACQKESQLSSDTFATQSEPNSTQTSASDRSGPCPLNDFLTTWGNNALNKEELLELTTGLDCWKAFEIAACGNVATSSTSKKGAQVSISVVYTWKPTATTTSTGTKTIIADYIEQTGTSPNIRYQIIDAKCSNVTELATLTSLLSKCTANQKDVYRAINAVDTYQITSATIVGDNGARTTSSNLTAPNGTSALAAGTVITPNLVRNVQFIVNTPKANCNTFNGRRNLTI